MNEEHELTNEHDIQESNPGLSRRDLLRRTAVGAGTVAVVGGGATRLDHGPVQETEAIAPAVAAAGIGASAAAGWVLRETEIIGSDDPPEGLTPGALKNSVYESARARASNNASTFVDNQNIIDQLDQAAYSEGKSAAFEAIEDQKSESEVLEDAKKAVEEHITTVEKNFLKSWNESASELHNLADKTAQHEEVGKGDLFAIDIDHDDRDVETLKTHFEDHTVQLSNGEDFHLHTIEYEWSYINGVGDESGGYQFVNPDEYEESSRPIYVGVDLDQEQVEYLAYNDWNPIYQQIHDTLDDVKNGIETWVEGVYGDVQSGDIDTSQLLTPSDRAEMTSEDEGFAQAQADLQTLNIPTDIEREAEIYFTELDTTLYGQLAYNGDGDLEAGEIDPDEIDGTVYLTYDLAQGSGLWTEYEEGIDGGVLTLTQRPPSEYAFEIVTTEDETAIVSSDEFEQSEDDPDKYIADLSDQLEDTIVDFEIFVTTEQSTQYETTRLDEPFEIITYRDSDGEEYDTTSFESSEPHTDDNYISQEEWEEDRERYEELIEKYEQSQDGGGAGLGGDSGTLAAAAAVGAGLIFLFGGS